MKTNQTPPNSHPPALAQPATHRRRWIGRFLAVGIALLLAPTIAGGPVAGPAVQGSGNHPQSSGNNISSWCPSVHYSTHASRNTTLAAPSSALPAGYRLSATYELEVYATNVSPLNVSVHVPSLTAVFPLTSGPAFRIVIAPHVFVLTSSAWTPESAVQQTRTLTTSLNFSTTAPAFLTSSRLAVMATANYGTLTLGFRWTWIVTPTSGPNVTSPWSTVGSQGVLPAIFDPAPYVVIASTSNRTAVIGSYFTANLTGAVFHTRFFNELENASKGIVARENYSYALTGNLSPFPATVRVLGWNGSLQPGHMLDHIRNGCMALLYSLTVNTVYPASASIHLTSATTGCGPIVLNGTSYSSGARVSVPPSRTAVGLSIGACPGHTFSSWTTSGGMDPADRTKNVTQAWISASGSLTANFV